MASATCRTLQYLAFFLLLVQFTQTTQSALVPKPKNRINHNPVQLSNTYYIVHANHHLKPPRFATLEHWYTSMVATHSPRGTNDTASVASRILYTYDTVMNGFAVRLTADEARRMSLVPGVTAVHEGRTLYPQTTRSPGFIGLDPEYGVWNDTDFGDGVIIGFVDSGIWPESPSFNDGGLGPVRLSWRGGCVGIRASLCNNKLVGAKDFSSAEEAGAGLSSPRDKVGHGTHVASTAAGSEVHDAGLFMFSRGTARGVAPKARIAMYKACREGGCTDAAVIAAVDAAVKDGVDIISISLGSNALFPLYGDSLAVATFGAQREGVFVVLSGGNSGPDLASVSNLAPWMTTVGAASVDRLFPANLTLGNDEVLIGQSLYTKKAKRTGMAPLVLLSSCSDDEISPDVVMGKIVVCPHFVGVYESIMVQNAGGAGLVGVNVDEWHADGVMAMPFTLPALTLGYSKGDKLKAYINSVANPVASFSFACETVTGETRAPTVVGFSSRGPNPIIPELLKPDVVAPGLNILAAWPGDVPLSNVDTRRSVYNVLSGTSMACPHAAGVAALIKKKHGDWTPAMIRSAMMTTAGTLDNNGRDISDQGVRHGAANFTSANPLAAGAGHVRPQLAMDPGLVYDASVQDYVDFLCSLNYTAEQLRIFSPDLTGCTRKLPGGPANLNYPSFVVVFDSRTRARTLTRTVTKVYEKPETYTVKVAAPDGVKVTVTPATLEFKGKNERRSYTVEFSSEAVKQEFEFGHISWENRKHQVMSPVVFMWND